MTAARLVIGTHKYDRGRTQFLHTDLRWLDVVAGRVQYIIVHQWLHNKAPQYLADRCLAFSNIADRQRLRLAQRYQLEEQLLPKQHT